MRLGHACLRLGGKKLGKGRGEEDLRKWQAPRLCPKSISCYLSLSLPLSSLLPFPTSHHLPCFSPPFLEQVEHFSKYKLVTDDSEGEEENEGGGGGGEAKRTKVCLERPLREGESYTRGT